MRLGVTTWRWFVIKRLRKKHTQEVLDQIYSSPHDHRIYGRGHDVRVEVTKVLAKNTCVIVDAKSGADLSCGNGDILNSLNIEKKIFGDFAAGYEFIGPLEENIVKIPNVDIFICSETLEHLDSPVESLFKIREKSKSLILTTPIECWEDSNREHYWAWDRDGVESLLIESGWRPDIFAFLDTTVFGEPYKYGIWSCL